MNRYYLLFLFPCAITTFSHDYDTSYLDILRFFSSWPNHSFHLYRQSTTISLNSAQTNPSPRISVSELDLDPLAPMELPRVIQQLNSSGKPGMYCCSACDYRSAYKTNADRHIRNVHGGCGTRYKCPLCEFRTKYKSCVDRHLKSFHKATVQKMWARIFREDEK